MTLEPIKALIAKLIDFRENELQELRDFLKVLEQTPEPITETPNASFLVYKNKTYARVLEDGEKLCVYPLPSLKISRNDPAVTRFLQTKVLEQLKQKYGCRYRLEIAEDGEGLRAVIVEGMGYDKKRFLNACAWSLEKAANRKSLK